jgi:thiol-disulfide isomerase/thioredoxin
MNDNGAMNDAKGPLDRRNWMLGAGAAAAALGAGVAWWRMTPQAVSGGDVHPVWAQQFETPEGTALRMDAFRGKPLLLNFWATWCPPCVEELPLIDAFWRAHKGQGHQVVALAIDQPSAVKRFLARQALGFPIGMAGLDGTELSKSLGNAAGGLPFTVFFKANGDIWRQKIGQITQDDLAQWLAASA